MSFPLVADAHAARRSEHLEFPDYQPVSAVGALAGVVVIVTGCAIGALTQTPVIIGVSILVGFYLMFSIKVAKQWQKVAVLRLGRYVGLRGPGLFHVIPVIETTSKFVDQRIRVTDVTAESALTRDTVPVNVD